MQDIIHNAYTPVFESLKRAGVSGDTILLGASTGRRQKAEGTERLK